MFSLTLDSSPFREAILLHCPNSWNRKWQPTPVFLPAKFCGQRSLGDWQSPGSQRVGTNWAAEHGHPKNPPPVGISMCHPLISLSSIVPVELLKHQHYISHVDDFSKLMGLGNVLTLNLQLLLNARIWFVSFWYKGICLNKYSWKKCFSAWATVCLEEWIALSESSGIAFLGCWLWPVEDNSIFSESCALIACFST